MKELEWVSIGKAAEQLGIELPRLRTWCNKGLVESDKRSTGRWIPSSEFPKIEKIKEIFGSGGNVTFEDVKEELIKHNLYSNLQRKTEEEEKTKEMSLALEKAFEKTGAAELFQVIATEFSSMKKEIEELRGTIENQTKLLENNDTKKELEQLKEQLIKGEETTEKAVEDAVMQSEKRFLEILESRDSKLVSSLKESMEAQKQEAAAIEEKPKGFLAKIFGK